MKVFIKDLSNLYLGSSLKDDFEKRGLKTFPYEEYDPENEMEAIIVYGNVLDPDIIKDKINAKKEGIILFQMAFFFNPVIGNDSWHINFEKSVVEAVDLLVFSDEQTEKSYVDFRFVSDDNFVHIGDNTTEFLVACVFNSDKLLIL